MIPRTPPSTVQPVVQAVALAASERVVAAARRVARVRAVPAGASAAKIFLPTARIPPESSRTSIRISRRPAPARRRTGSPFRSRRIIGARPPAPRAPSTSRTRWASGFWTTTSSSSVMSSFNVINPYSARAIMRQSAADTFSLTRFIEASLQVPANKSPTGSAICFDTSRISFFGHSQGGLSGALAAPYESGIDSWVLSGAGGGMSITLMERSDSFVDTQALLTTFLQPEPGESFTEFHPVVGLIQILIEASDPINYSRFWVSDTRFNAPANLLLTSGELDTAAPHRTASAMAVAARMPIVAPVALPFPAFSVAGLSPATAPVSLNVNGVTAGFLQWADDGQDASHFVIFDRPEAINASMRLLESATFDGAAVIERDPNSDAR